MLHNVAVDLWIAFINETKANELVARMNQDEQLGLCCSCLQCFLFFDGPTLYCWLLSKVLSLLVLRPVLLKRHHKALAWDCLVNKLNGPPIGSLAQCWDSRGKVSRRKSLQNIHQTLLTPSAVFNISLRPAQPIHSNVEVQITQRWVRKEQISKAGVLLRWVRTAVFHTDTHKTPDVDNMPNARVSRFVFKVTESCDLFGVTVLIKKH